MAEDRYRMRYGPGGWVQVLGPQIGALYLRFAPDAAGRLRMTELYVDADRPIDSSLLRSLKLGRVEAWANSPAERELITGSLDSPGPDFQKAAAEVFGPFSTKLQRERARTMATLHRRLDAHLDVPDGPRYPDAFYRQVAEAYGRLSAASGRPAAEIAAVNNVPATTVHRWIKEARRRGFLGPGRKGKGGA